MQTTMEHTRNRIRTRLAKVVGTAPVLAAMLAAPQMAAAAETPIKVMTYNTHHGGLRTSPASTDAQLDTIAAQNPDVVVLQEAYSSQFKQYVDGLNARMGTTAW